ncbi:MAG: FliM/FliN family flagellar motor switch protein [Planctomycetales bacterium]|nr:FliM/FliN family flagellar motor switch protein [Planctomycetales bacterium]
MTETLDSAMATVEQELHRQQAAPSGTLGQTTDADVAAKAPHFANFTLTQAASGKTLDHLCAVRFEAEVVIGRAELSVDEMLGLGIGSVVELNRLVSEPVDLIVQKVRVARGEVVVVNDQFAIRITEIIGAPSAAS